MEVQGVVHKASRGYKASLKGMTIWGRDGKGRGCGWGAEGREQMLRTRSNHLTWKDTIPRGSASRPGKSNEEREKQRCSPQGRRYLPPLLPFTPEGPRNKCVFSIGAGRETPGLHPQTPKENAGVPTPALFIASSLPRRSRLAPRVSGAGLTQAARPGPAAAVAGRRQPGENEGKPAGCHRTPGACAYRHRPRAGPRKRDFPVPASAGTGSTFCT